MTDQKGTPMDECRFWYSVWRLVATSFVVLIASVASCSSYKSHLIGTSGDPVAAACALSDSRVDSACLVVVARDK